LAISPGEIHLRFFQKGMSMNLIFMTNMQHQIRDVEATRNMLANARSSLAPTKGSVAYDYLSLIFKNGQATSREITTLYPLKDRKFMPSWVLKPFIEKGVLEFISSGTRSGGCYKPAEGHTAKSLGLELDQ
jgi:hypothetical protein